MKNLNLKIGDIWDTYAWGIAFLFTIGIIVFALGVAFGVMCLKAWLVMILWNWVAVSLFNAPTLSFWLAFGLSWLCSLLFKTVSKSKSND
jgi:hypothetical protein